MTEKIGLMNRGLRAAIFILGMNFWKERNGKNEKESSEFGIGDRGLAGARSLGGALFMVMAMGQGLNVSSPYGGLRPYDVGVESGGRIVRIQVKCTRFEYEKDCTA